MKEILFKGNLTYLRWFYEAWGLFDESGSSLLTISNVPFRILYTEMWTVKWVKIVMHFFLFWMMTLRLFSTWKAKIKPFHLKSDLILNWRIILKRGIVFCICRTKSPLHVQLRQLGVQPNRARGWRRGCEHVGRQVGGHQCWHLRGMYM